MSQKLEKLRQEIASIDDEIYSLVAKRLDVAKQIGLEKLAAGLPIKNYRTEKKVFERATEAAKKHQSYQELNRDIAETMIRYSVLAQDEFHRKHKSQPLGRQQKILVVGGAGQMGQWMAQFFQAQGHDVVSLDQKPPTYDIPQEKRPLELAVPDYSMVCLATPIMVTAKIIDSLTVVTTDSHIFDICSLKSPLIEPIAKAEKAGRNITSVHPMFGPKIDLLAGQRIVICQTNNEQTCKKVRELFEDTTATLVDMPLIEHDKCMGYVLGLSHFINLAFAATLHDADVPIEKLHSVSSTTFNAQLEVTEPVTRENPYLYYEIQAENANQIAIIKSLQSQITEYLEVISQKKQEAFVAKMQSAKI